MSNEIIHDFRPDNLKWGWNGLSFDVCADKKTALMMGIGTGIEAGHFIALRQGLIDYAYKVLTVEYDANPKDLFKATIKICGTIEG